jgi:hypothetical protein
VTVCKHLPQQHLAGVGGYSSPALLMSGSLVLLLVPVSHHGQFLSRAASASLPLLASPLLRALQLRLVTNQGLLLLPWQPSSATEASAAVDCQGQSCQAPITRGTACQPHCYSCGPTTVTAGVTFFLHVLLAQLLKRRPG